MGMTESEKKVFEEGYVRYACGRGAKCHKDGKVPVEYMTPNDKAAADWMAVTYTDACGVAVTVGLCPACAQEYAELKAKQDAEMAAWVEKGLI